MSARTTLIPLVCTAILSACSGGTGAPDPDGGTAGGGAGGGSAAGGGSGGAGGAGGGAMGCTCSLPNAVAACGDAGCTLVRCEPGFRNLDGDASNGCEASCQPLNVLASGTLDFDVKVIALSGKVTANGQTLPAPRGTLRFALAGSKPLDVALPAAGEATYAAKLFAGQYKVSYVKNGVATALKSMAFTASGALDFDVPPGTVIPSGTNVVITGVLTTNGGIALGTRPGGQPRATVRFVPAVGASVTAVVPATGAATYSATLPPGTYDLYVDGDLQCGAANAVVPCQASLRKKGLTVTTSGSLDLDLPIVTVGGAVTVNGAAMPAGTSTRGLLKLKDASGEGPALSLGSSGPAQWSTLVYPGNYDLVVSREGCSGTGGLPCQTFTAKKQVPLTAPGVVDLDLQVFDVSGQVLANGQALKDSAQGQSRGALTFKPGGARLALGGSGPAGYQTRLYAGSYEVELTNDTDCANGALPCATRTVKTITVSASGVLDLDVPVMKVNGTLTVNGAAMPASPSGTARGSVTLEGPFGSAKVGLTATGPGTFSAVIYPGTYQVRFENDADCPLGPTPCQARVLEASHAFTGDGTLAYDLPVVEVTGTVTHNGQAVAGSTAQRGEVRFRDGFGNTVVSRLGTTGPAQYRARLFPGSYELLFQNSTDCPAGDTSPLPCQGETQVAPVLELTVSGVRDFDLKSVTLSGLVTVNGAQMGGSFSGGSRGQVRFGAFGGASSAPASRALTASGAATYQVRLVPGRYDVGLENVQDCTNNGALPCQAQVLAGCEAP